MNNLAVATIGGGCFWCIEAIFNELQGVHRVISGYAGGHTDQPTYKTVCSGNTGHAEVVQIHFDAPIISHEDILRIFLLVHDPTTLNRQGADVGTQYRSIIFYHDESQYAISQKIIAEFEKNHIWTDKIVTEVTTFTYFFPAEDYHQQYYQYHEFQPYCRVVITPKIKKFRLAFSNKLKTKSL